MRRIWLAGLVVCVVGFAWYFGMNYTGYCHSRFRYLSDQEKIEIGVRFLLESIYPPSVPIYEVRDGERVFIDNQTPKDPIRYGDLQEFFARNSDCCKVSLSARENFEAPTMSRLTGRLAAFVNVNFLVRYRAATGEEIEIPMRIDPGISNCGEIWFGH